MTVRQRYGMALAAAALLGACQGGEGPAREITLDQPEATLARTFPHLGNVVELRDGRVAFTDLTDHAFLFADLASGDVIAVGQHADTIRAEDPAPGRHKLPGFVLRFPGDTVGLVDFAAERTTLWTERGAYVGILSGRDVGGHNQPLIYDQRGNGYKEDIRSVLGGLEPGNELGFDSLAVLRLTRGDTVADTIARLKLPAWGRGRFGEQVRMVSTIFSGRDIFGVLPDGALWVARAADNSVDWRLPDGTWQRGRGRAWTTILVPQEEKDAFLLQVRLQMAQAGAPAGIELSYPFADEKPPFAGGQTNPAGEVWLNRSRAWGDSVAVWDVVGRDGRAIRSVRLPKGAMLAGFGGEGRVYLFLREADGRQRIARYVVK